MKTPFLTPLSADQIAQAGVPGTWSYGYADQVRFSEIDALNHVNNVAYLVWFEMARVQYFQTFGLTKYRDDDPQFVVRAQSADYRAAMYMNTAYIIATRTVSFRRTSFTMEYVCYADGIRASGQSVIVSLEPDGSAKRPLPDAVLAQFREIDLATEA